MLRGHQSWIFSNKPVITATGVTGGPFEANGPLKEDFDLLYGDLWMKQDTYEKAHSYLLEKAIEVTLNKAGIK
jgi:stage V sporulation protein AD